MPFEIFFKEDDKYVIVTISGMPTHSEHCSAIEQALQLCKEKDCKKI